MTKPFENARIEAVLAEIETNPCRTGVYREILVDALHALKDAREECVIARGAVQVLGATISGIAKERDQARAEIARLRTIRAHDMIIAGQDEEICRLKAELKDLRGDYK
jgi:hypothetical protein